MKGLWIAALLMVAGCEEIDPSGDVFKPRAPAVVGGSTDKPVGPQGDFDFDADAPPEQADGEDDADGMSAIFEAYGVKPPPPEPPEPPQPAVDAPMAVAAAPLTQAWRPGEPLPGSWGVRLVATVVTTQPPSAMLGLPDGSQQLVYPGTLLPSVGVVVLAIGHNAVQIAEIVPQGDRARVDSKVLSALHPSAPAGAAAP